MSTRRPTPSVRPPQDAAATAAPQDISPLPAQSPVSARRSSDSFGPVTPTDLAVAGLPTAPTRTTPVASVRLPATTPSCAGALRSAPPLATGSSDACAPAPSGAGATTVAADPDSPSSVPRSAESDLRATISESAAHPGDPSSACVPASCGFQLRPRSTAQTRRATAQTSTHARSPPSPRAPSFPVPRDHGRTSPLPHGAAVAALAVPQFRYPQKQFVGSPGASSHLRM